MSLYPLLLFIVSATAHLREPPSFPVLRTIDELAAASGYGCTNYEVITEDGHSLWLHRLGSNEGPPVLIQHGVLLAADSWVTRGTAKDLAFILLEDGFDVWLSNQRGTVFNEYNIYYNRSDPRFWDSSITEAGVYDIPAFIDTILDIRGVKQLFYIGHSLGTTVFLVMASSRPDYNSKIRAAVLMSPVAYTPTSEELAPSVRVPLQFSGTIERALRAAGDYELFPRTEKTIRALRRGCTFGSPTARACLDIFGSAFGEHRTNLDPEEWNGFVPYYFAGTSLKILYHAAQLYASGEFREFDYGPARNQEVYGKSHPPEYPVDRVTAPVALYWGDNDYLLSRTSVGTLAFQLPNLVFSKELPDPKTSHIDPLIGMDTNRVLYPDVLRLLKSFSQEH